MRELRRLNISHNPILSLNNKNIADIGYFMLEIDFNMHSAVISGYMEHPMYMQIPEGMIAPPNHCLKLQRSIYGLVQSSRELWLTFTMHLKNTVFK